MLLSVKDHENKVGNTDLRFQLRDETQDAHKRLDMALIDHNLTTLTGLRSYLYVHFLARTHLQIILTGYAFLRDDEEKLTNIRLDFDVLGVKAPIWETPPPLGDYHALGLIYVLAGSALGSKLLYKNWSAAKNINILKAKHFMSSARDSQVWNAFLTHIHDVPYGQNEIDSMIEAANYCFSVFEAANNQIIER